MKINSNYYKMYAQKNYKKNTFKDVNSEPNSNINVNSTSSKRKNTTIEYILEGGVIRVYIVNDSGKKECIRIIPLSQATPEILAKVKNISFIDILSIVNMQKKEKEKNTNKSMVSKL